MKHCKWLFVLGWTSLVPTFVLCQSTMEFQAGTTIEVTAGADICADMVIINGSYLGSGTKCGGTLPVEMSAVAAVANQKDVTLSWTTATEVNNLGFTIERRIVSTYSIQFVNNRALQTSFSWIDVGSVPGSGTSSRQHRYSFTDKDLAPGRYGYRIKQTDNNGSVHFTDALEIDVRMASKEFTVGQNFPNPFNPSTTITFTVDRQGPAIVSVYNTLGEEVQRLFDGVADPGKYYNLAVNGSTLASGIYFYQVSIPGKVIVKKMLLLR